MIDWVNVTFSSIWIAGLALMLAAASYYYWLAKEEGVSVGTAFQQPAFQRFMYIGLILIGIGLIGTSGHIAETLVAVVLIVLCAFGLMKLYRQARENRQ